MNAARVWAVVALLVVAAGAARAQGPGGPGGRGRHGGGRGGFGLIGLTAIPEVQAELRLDSAQQDLLKQLGQEMFEQSREMFRETMTASPDERRKKWAALWAGQEKKVRDILDPRQWARLRQLDLQWSGTRALERPDVQDDLRFSQDQRQKVTDALTAEQAAVQPLFQRLRDGRATTPEQRDEIRRKFEEIRTQRDARLNAVLTDNQRRQFEAMKGAPFTFPERRRRPNR